VDDLPTPSMAWSVLLAVSTLAMLYLVMQLVSPG